MTTVRGALRCRVVGGKRAMRTVPLLKYSQHVGFQRGTRHPALNGPIWRLHLGIPTRADINILETCMDEQMRESIANIVKVIVDTQFLEALDRLCKLTESLTGVPITKEQRSHLFNKLFWKRFYELRAQLRVGQKQQEAFTLLREGDRASMPMLRKVK